MLDHDGVLRQLVRALGLGAGAIEPCGAYCSRVARVLSLQTNPVLPGGSEDDVRSLHPYMGQTVREADGTVDDV